MGECRHRRPPIVDPVVNQKADMEKDRLRITLAEDIAQLRAKAEFYAKHHLFEAARIAENLASNLELALTTLPSDSDSEIA